MSRINLLFPLLFWGAAVLILYTYVGYPLLIGLLAKFSRKKKIPEKPLPTCTLLIAAYNEEIVIEEKLRNSLLIDYPTEKLQILVAADGSDDRTTEIVKTFLPQGIELNFEHQRLGKINAINRAVREARGEILVFSDANNFYKPDAVQRLVKPFADPRIGGVVGAKRICSDGSDLEKSESMYWRYESFIKESETVLGCCTANSGEIFAMRKELFSPCPRHIINDDFYLMLRILAQGYDMHYAPQALSYEKVSDSMEEENQRRSRIVAGRFQAMKIARQLLAWKRPLIYWQLLSHKFLRPFVALAMIGLLIASLLSSIYPLSSGPSFLFLRPPWGWILFISQVVFYALIFTAERIKLPKPINSTMHLFYYLVQNNLASLEGMTRHLTGTQTPVWKKANRRKIIDPFQVEDHS